MRKKIITETVTATHTFRFLVKHQKQATAKALYSRRQDVCPYYRNEFNF